MSRHPKRFLLLTVLALLALVAVCAQPARAQTPTVSLTNLTRGGEVFYVGDEWWIHVTGPPNQDVMVCGTHNGESCGCTVYGQTDGSGIFDMSGVMDASTIGTWTEIWYVGPLQAVPNLAFEVRPLPEQGCEGYAFSLPPVIFSTDYYGQHYNDPWPDYVDPGFAEVIAQITNAGCTFVWSNFEVMACPPGMLDGSRNIFTPFTIEYEVWDNQHFGNCGDPARCFYCNYPVLQTGAFTFVAVEFDLDVYVLFTGVELWVNAVR